MKRKNKKSSRPLSSFRRVAHLCKAKVICTLRNRSIEALSQILVGVIFWQIQFYKLLAPIPNTPITSIKRTVKAGMATRQPILTAIVPMNIEPGDSVHALQLLESIERNLRRARNELE